MKAVVFLVLLASADIVFCASVDSTDGTKEPSFYEQLLREVKRQEQELKGKDLKGLAEKFITDIGSIGKEFTDILRSAMTVATSGDAEQHHESSPSAVQPTAVVKTKSSDEESETNVTKAVKNNQHKEKSIMDILSEILTSTMAGDHEEAKARIKRDTDAAMSQGDMASLLQSLLAAQNGNNEAPAEDLATKIQADQSSSAQATGNNNGVTTRLGKPAPIVLIPGPPGKPGKPGVPGFPGKPGKLPNFRGLKAIITTRVAELLAFLAFLAIASIGKFLGLLGLLLGLVLPVYGKLKKSGALVPDPQSSYGQSSYGQPAPSYGSPYGRGKRSVAVDEAISDKMVSFVLSKVEAAQKKFE